MMICHLNLPYIMGVGLQLQSPRICGNANNVLIRTRNIVGGINQLVIVLDGEKVHAVVSLIENVMTNYSAQMIFPMT